MSAPSEAQQTPIKEEDASLPSYGPVGVSRALQSSRDGPARATLFSHEFAQNDGVALVTGGHRGIGLEAALALVEAGARAVYCVDLPAQPDEEWEKVRDYAARLEGKAGEGRLEYISADVRDQEAMWKIGETIGDKEGRLDVCVASAGLVGTPEDCLTYSAEEFQKVMSVNVNGSLFAAQAAGRQMARFGNGGSIILVASLGASVTCRDHAWIAYQTSKSALLQMARSLACELGPQRIRVNSFSPGFTRTSLIGPYLDAHPEVLAAWSNGSPLGRIGRPDEVRGTVAWLASDASSFCTGSDIVTSGGYHAW